MFDSKYTPLPLVFPPHVSTPENSTVCSSYLAGGSKLNGKEALVSSASSTVLDVARTSPTTVSPSNTGLCLVSYIRMSTFGRPPEYTLTGCSPIRTKFLHFEPEGRDPIQTKMGRIHGQAVYGIRTKIAERSGGCCGIRTQT